MSDLERGTNPQEVEAFATIIDNTVIIDREKATKVGLTAIVTDIVNAKHLWFKLIYDVDGSTREIRAREILELREKSEDERTNFINTTVEDLSVGENIMVLIGYPDEADTRQIY